MPRVRDDTKRSAILDAAVAEFAVRGAQSTPTSAISKAAGVAEGTLFTYFPTKQRLINELYVGLKLRLAHAMFSGYPSEAPPRERLRHLWDRYVEWGVTEPQQHKVMMQLSLSDQISADCRALALAPYEETERLVLDSIAQGAIRNLPVSFIAALFGGMAETTMQFAAQAGQKNLDFGYLEAGFEVFWHGVSAR